MVSVSVRQVFVVPKLRPRAFIVFLSSYVEVMFLERGCLPTAIEFRFWSRLPSSCYGFLFLDVGILPVHAGLTFTQESWREQ